MKNKKSRLAELFNKPAWSDEEKQWLLNYLEEADTDDLKSLMKAQFEAEQAPSVKDQEYSAKILALIHEKIGVPKKQGRVVDGKVKFLRSLAAACIVGLLGFAGYVFFKPEAERSGPGVPQTANAKPVRKNDVLPGGNKATLTLGDGSVITLSDEQNGELTAQGNTKVFKLNGQLTYRSADAKGSEVLYNTMSTPRGGQYQVVLADGTSVWLNSESSLRFPTGFVGKERRVEISGEAYFEVAKNKAMPFVVSVNGAEVQVLGTHFDVKAYKDEAVLKTTLLEGAVKFVFGSNTTSLKPGQQSQLKGNGEVNVLSGVDVDKVVAWKNGYFDLDGEDLGTIAKQLSRWYDVEIEGANKINDKFYAEIPRATKLSDVLHALELTGKVHFSIEGKKVMVR